jgi:hypothetical protein
MLVWDKHASLFGLSISDDEKSFMTSAPESNFPASLVTPTSQTAVTPASQSLPPSLKMSSVRTLIENPKKVDKLSFSVDRLLRKTREDETSKI